jgi:ribose/xylose/arabinose/galactoside ABC-type transport system permease subunit
MSETVPSKKALAHQQDRSDIIRANIKRFYIYFVLALVVVVFSVVRLDEVNWFERGHFLNPNNLINLLRIAVPIITVSGAFTFLMIAEYIDLSIGSTMSLASVIFAWMILNGFSFQMA